MMNPALVYARGMGFELSEAIVKMAPLWYSHDPFPLTPALSLRERENQGPRYNNSKRLAFSNALPTMLPLPEGEGRREGERAEIAERWRLAIGSSHSGFGFHSAFVIQVSNFPGFAAQQAAELARPVCACRWRRTGFLW